MTIHIDFDEGDGSLYEFDGDGNPIALFTADPECPLETFEEFKKKAALIVKAVNMHEEMVRELKNLYTAYGHRNTGMLIAKAKGDTQ